jgi:uncharacterized membrane protein
MGHLVFLGPDDLFKADEGLLALRKLQQQYLIDLEEVAVVVRNADGTMHIKQSQRPRPNLGATASAQGRQALPPPGGRQ